MSESLDAPDRLAAEMPQPAKKRSPAARLGCGLALALWFTLLLAPCGLFYLAANGEIRLRHADIPQPHEHPRLLISLISEARQRGLRIENSYLVAEAGAAGETCVQTNARFLLWESSGDIQDARYCDCYQQRAAAASWQLTQTFPGDCLKS